jgi:hypothetical protein
MRKTSLIDWAERHQLSISDMQMMFNISRVTAFNWLRSNTVGSEFDRQLIWAAQRVLPGLTEADIMAMAPERVKTKLQRLEVQTMLRAREVNLQSWEREQLPGAVERVLDYAEKIKLRNNMPQPSKRGRGRPARPISRDRFDPQQTDRARPQQVPA